MIGEIHLSYGSEESQQYIMILGARKITGKKEENRKNCLVYIKKIWQNGILRVISGRLKHLRCMKCQTCLKWVTGGIYLPQNTVNEVNNLSDEPFFEGPWIAWLMMLLMVGLLCGTFVFGWKTQIPFRMGSDKNG